MQTPATLAERTTLRVGGPAADWIVARTDQELVDAVRSCDDAGTPVLILGGGSNVLVGDAGFPGTVIEVATTGVHSSVDPETVLLEVAAGEPWDAVVARAVIEGWSGIEALSGIPGRTGATPIQNVGAYGQDVGQVVTTIRVLDRASGRIETLESGECGFGYRTSRFTADVDGWVVLGVTLALRPDRRGVVRYRDLAGRLGVEIGATADVRQVRAAVLELRRGKGMVLDPADPDTRSAGSFFTNPIVDRATSGRIPAECPRYPAELGVKLSAAWLIENAGVAPGFCVAPGARARVSTKHTLALTNADGATAADLLALAGEIRDRVLSRFGIELQPEVRLVNCSLQGVGPTRG